MSDLAGLLAQGTLEAEAPIRHRDGHIVWVAMSVNAVTSPSTDEDARGHRLTSEPFATSPPRGPRPNGNAPSPTSPPLSAWLRASARCCRQRSTSAARALGVRTCRGRHRGRRASTTRPSTWRERCRRRSGMTSTRRCAASLEDARAWLPLTVEPVGWATESRIPSHGIVATLSRDITLWLEFA